MDLPFFIQYTPTGVHPQTALQLPVPVSPVRFDPSRSYSPVYSLTNSIPTPPFARGRLGGGRGTLDVTPPCFLYAQPPACALFMNNSYNWLPLSDFVRNLPHVCLVERESVLQRKGAPEEAKEQGHC